MIPQLFYIQSAKCSQYKSEGLQDMEWMEQDKYARKYTFLLYKMSFSSQLFSNFAIFLVIFGMPWLRPSQSEKNNNSTFLGWTVHTTPKLCVVTEVLGPCELLIKPIKKFKIDLKKWKKTKTIMIQRRTFKWYPMKTALKPLWYKCFVEWQWARENLFFFNP